MKKNSFLFFFILMMISTKIYTQQKEINWITFEQLEDSLNMKPKKVFLSFYADWCAYCKKMDRVAFKNAEVINILNSEYYSIKMDVQSKDTILFGGKTYLNKEVRTSRRPKHEIPLLLASRKNEPFSLPANLILDKNFTIRKRFFEYLSPKKMVSILK
ncbi:thioredoxin family protein [Polaribacter sp. R77954]|uniref:thioredoxin family protein n=1 Tax=Polaribacter sp. R77954 TaxID=3093870 RepID=UPI0037C730CF